MRAGNSIWFRGAVPLLGRVLTGDPDAYRYLPKSVEYLPEPGAMLQMIERAGFCNVRRELLSGGITQLIVGTRA